jgi:SPP1 family predicted phage head-tail adaptor
VSIFTGLLNNDFLVSRPVRIPNGQGGWAIGYTPLGAIRGRLRPASGSERDVAQQEQRAITHVLYVVAGEDIQREDTVEGDEVTVKVQGVREPSRADHHLEIDCLEIQKPTKEVGS